jgi:hypothetical protein
MAVDSGWTPAQSPRFVRVRSAVVYALMIAGTLLGFYRIRMHGDSLHAPKPTAAMHFGAGTAGVQIEVLLHVLVALTAVILFARLLGALFRFIHQPPVIGEITAGISQRVEVQFPASFMTPAPFLQVLKREAAAASGNDRAGGENRQGVRKWVSKISTVGTSMCEGRNH